MTQKDPDSLVYFHFISSVDKRKDKVVSCTHQERVWGSGGISLLILKLGTRWEVSSLTPRLPYPRQEFPHFSLTRRLDGSWSLIGHFLTLLGIEP
jgi:hypothetical protein